MSNETFDSLYKKITGPSQKTTYTEKPIDWRLPKYNYNLNLNNINDIHRNADYNLPTFNKVVNNAPVPIGLKYKKYDDIPNKDLYSNTPTKVRNEKLRGHKDASEVMDDITRNKSIYETDVKDTAKWLYKRKGHNLTDELWEGIQKARLSQNSALRPIPENIYYFSHPDFPTGVAPILNEENNEQEYIPFVSVNPENPLNDLQGLPLEKLNGYIRYTDDLSNARDLYTYNEIMDHELSHAFNLSQYTNPSVESPLESRFAEQSLWNKMLEHIPDNYSIYSGPLTPELSSPFIKNEVHNLFNGTYIDLPLEYIGAMARIKRLAAGDGYDVFNADDKIARDGMARTLHSIATETNPELLPYEMQRIHTWANTSFDNYFNTIQQHRDLIQRNDPGRREEIIRLDNILKNRKKMELDPNSPLYYNILRYLTPETLRALVNNSPNTQSLNNIHLT